MLGAAAYYTHQGLGDFSTGRALALAGVAEGVSELSGMVHLMAEATLAMSYMTTGDEAKVREVIAEADQRLEALGGNAYPRANLHSAAATMLLTVGDIDGAAREAELGMEIARQGGNPTCLTLALFAFGWVHTNDDPESALAAFNESIALTRAGALDGAFGAALCQAALIRARKDDARGALEGLREAIAFSHEVGDHTNFSNAINRGTEITGRLGHAEVSAVFAGLVASKFVEKSLMYVLFGQEKVEHDLVQERVRAELGEEAYAAASARGAAMAYDDILAYALTELDRVLQELDDA